MERRTSNNNLVLGIQSVYELNISAAVDASSTEVYFQANLQNVVKCTYENVTRELRIVS